MFSFKHNSDKLKPLFNLTRVQIPIGFEFSATGLNLIVKSPTENFIIYAFLDKESFSEYEADACEECFTVANLKIIFSKISSALTVKVAKDVSLKLQFDYENLSNNIELFLPCDAPPEAPLALLNEDFAYVSQLSITELRVACNFFEPHKIVIFNIVNGIFQMVDKAEDNNNSTTAVIKLSAELLKADQEEYKQAFRLSDLRAFLTAIESSTRNMILKNNNGNLMIVECFLNEPLKGSVKFYLAPVVYEYD